VQGFFVPATSGGRGIYSAAFSCRPIGRQQAAHNHDRTRLRVRRRKARSLHGGQPAAAVMLTQYLAAIVDSRPTVAAF